MVKDLASQPLKYAVTTVLAAAAVILAACAGGMAAEDKSVFTLFESSRRVAGLPVVERLEAVEALASAENAEPWIVLLLTDEETLSGYSAFEPQVVDDMRAGIEPFERGALAHLMMHLQTPLSEPLAWAVTVHLNDDGRGRFSRRELVPDPDYGAVHRLSQGETPPLKDIARGVLMETYQVDHGYDVDAWRQEIAAAARQ